MKLLNKLVLTLLFIIQMNGYAQIQISENFDAGNSIPTSSSNAPTVPTDYSTSSGTWTLFKAYRHGTTNYSAPYAIRLLKNTAEAPAYIITSVLNTAGSISFQAYGSSSKPLHIYKTTNGGTDWVYVDSVLTGSGVFALRSVTVNDGSPNIRLKIVNGTGAGNDLNVDNIEVTSYSSAPTIIVSTNSLPSFGGVQTGNNSSSLQYTVSGYNLTSDVAITAPEYFSVSLNDTLFTSSVNVIQAGGVVTQTNIYVRFSPVLPTGTINGQIVHTSATATTQNTSVVGIALADEPNVQSAITFGEVTGNSIIVHFTGGNGSKRVLVARENNSVSWNPSDGSILGGVNNNFSTAQDQGMGNKTVYNGNGNSVTVTGLEGNRTYHFAVFEYNEGSNNSQNYNISAPGTGSQTTLPVPTIIVIPALLSFGNVQINTTSAEKTYIVSGSTLSPENGNITVTAPAGYEVSLTTGSGFSGTLQIPYTGSVLNDRTVFVRFVPTDIASYNGVIINSGGSAADAQVSLTGNGISAAQPNVFEAEDGLLDGSYIRTQFAGYTGWGYVDLADRTGSSLEFVLRKETASTETVTIHFANGGSSRSLRVDLNDNQLGTLSFPSTGGWTSWSTVTYQVPFVAGINRLKFSSTTNNTNANIDKILLTGETATPVYKLTLLKSGAGSVSANLSGIYFDKGTSIVLTATPDAGNSFYRWNGTDVSYGNPLVATMNSQRTQIAIMTDTAGFANFSYYPNPKGFASVPGLGFANGTTGGEGPEKQIVYVSTTTELQTLMQRRIDVDGTANHPPLTVYVVGILARDAGIGEMVDVKDVYDISIIGVGRDATITGFGLNITRSRNIIVRNIKFASWGDDGISVDGDDDPNKGNHIWIDHCTFSYTPPPGYPAASTPDGSLDITHTADFVTVSYCLFDSTDKNSLVGHSNSNVVDTAMKITYHHNWFKNSNQRNPRVRFGKVHVLNNYYTNNSIYGVSSNMEADVLVEGNYFFNTPIPTETSRDGGPPGDLVERFNIFVNTGPAGTRGTAFEASDYYLYSLDSAAQIPQIVPGLVGSGKYDFSFPEHIVPVELVAFSASVAGEEVIVAWKTATELNNAGWDVESKQENGNWEKIGFVTGNGNSISENIYSFRDSREKVLGKYYYRINQIDFDGSSTYSPIAEVVISKSLTYRLFDNYPNPFNPSTVIKYQIPQNEKVSLIIYDLLGKQVAVLVNEFKQGGSYQVNFEAGNLSSGVYVYQLRAGAFVTTKQMLFLK